MTHIPKYSVIIPVYNAEKTLHHCVDSLIYQKYQDAEIILVNDGSKDQSEAICRSYAEKYTQVKVISKTNGGVSSARNAGLMVASGTYILFVDSDDYVSNDYFRVLDLLEQEEPVDYLMFSSYCVREGSCTKKTMQDYFSNDLNDVMQRLSRAYYRKTINAPWNKRYRRDIIQEYGLRFNEGLSIGEDKLFNLEYAMHCHSCRVSSSHLYYVSVEDTNSLSRRIRSDMREQSEILEAAIQTVIQTADIEEKYRECFRIAENFLRVRSVYAHAKRMHRTGIAWCDRLAEIRRMCRNLNQQRLKIPTERFCLMISIPVKLKLAFVIDLVAKWLAC